MRHTALCLALACLAGTVRGQGLTMSPAPATGAGADSLVAFDPDSTEIRWGAGHWQLLAGGRCLKDFGTREADAREALRLIRDLRLNQYGTVGTPRPVIEYWLTNGQAPQGFAGRARLLPLDANSLRAEEVQGQWCLRDDRRLFFVFGAHADEARRALDVIRRYGFTQVGYVGQFTPAMMYFLGGAAAGRDTRMAWPATFHAPANPAGMPTLNPDPRRHAALRNAHHEEAAPPAVPMELIAMHQLAAVKPLLADQPTLGDRVAFDGRQLQVRLDGDEWNLYAGSYLIARFGTQQSEALRALNVLQAYRCNEHCLVGRPRPAFTFFLTNGQAPRGEMFGLNGTSFRPQDLTVHQFGPDWGICDQARILLRVSGSETDAKKLLDFIKKQDCDYLCRIGPAEPYGVSLLLHMR